MRAAAARYRQARAAAATLSSHVALVHVLALLAPFLMPLLSLHLRCHVAGYHISLVCSGVTTKEHLKGRKHGARRITLCDRMGCCSIAPSELQPRRFVPLQNTVIGAPSGGGSVAAQTSISHHQL